MTSLEELYQAVILDHHRAPRNAGRLPAPTHAAELHNPLCGDRVTLTLELLEQHVLSVRCEVQGCALCRASGSLLTEAVEGRTAAEVEQLVSRFLAWLGATPKATPGEEPQAPGEGLEPLAPLAQVRQFRSRMRCVSLPWEALQRALGLA